MFGELEDSSVVQPQALPHCIATLHRGIKRTHSCLIAMDKIPINVDQKVLILFIEPLEHATS
jgi:hypothetical protein